jgi:hypothetical protein
VISEPLERLPIREQRRDITDGEGRFATVADSGNACAARRPTLHSARA